MRKEDKDKPLASLSLPLLAHGKDIHLIRKSDDKRYNVPIKKQTDTGHLNTTVLPAIAKRIINRIQADFTGFHEVPVGLKLIA